MRSLQLILHSPTTSRGRIGFLVSAVILAGLSAPANAQSAGVMYLGIGPSTAPAKPPARHATASPLVVLLSEWKVEPSQRTVPTGEVEITVKNSGTIPHTLEIEGQGIEKELDPINAGASSKLRINLKPGTYELYCPIGDGAHKKMGMIAKIEVTAPRTGSEMRGGQSAD